MRGTAILRRGKRNTKELFTSTTVLSQPIPNSLTTTGANAGKDVSTRAFASSDVTTQSGFHTGNTRECSSFAMKAPPWRYCGQNAESRQIVPQTVCCSRTLAARCMAGYDCLAMTNDIIEKLRKHLAGGVRTECRVVYLLAAIRKTLEDEKPNPRALALWMFCHWALHVNLSHSPTPRPISCTKLMPLRSTSA